MGLMYIFPVTDNQNEGDRAEIKNGKLILRTYGLPMIFWGYLAAASSVVFLMWIASRETIAKMLSYTEDPTLVYLGLLVKWSLLLSPVIALGFFFYEKVIVKKEATLTVWHKVFFIPIYKKTYDLHSASAFLVEHFMDSPNMAKLRRQQGLDGQDAMKHFENKGYFELNLINAQSKKIKLDRHSRKVDLIKLKDLLSKY